MPNSIYTGSCLQKIQRRKEKEEEKEKRIRGRSGAHEKNVSQRSVGFENAQMTAKIGPLPDGIFILFTRHATSGGIMF